MKNEIWEKVFAFLVDLRCSEMQRKSRVELESCVAEKKKLKILQEEYVMIKELLSEKDKLILEEYVNQIKQVSFEEQQEAYCQGIVDILQVLAGLQLIPIDEDIQNLIEKLS